MDEKMQLDEARERVIDAIAKNMGLYGVSPSIGRLYGLMYFHGEPLTLDDMKEELGMSKTSMSTSVRSLYKLKMVQKVWRRGVRKDLYQVEEDWYQTFSDLFSTKWRDAITMNTNVMKRSLRDLEEMINNEEISDETREKAVKDKEKLLYALEYYDWLNRFVDCLETGEIFELVPKKKDNVTK